MKQENEIEHKSHKHVLGDDIKCTCGHCHDEHEHHHEHDHEHDHEHEHTHEEEHSEHCHDEHCHDHDECEHEHHEHHEHHHEHEHDECDCHEHRHEHDGACHCHDHHDHIELGEHDHDDEDEGSLKKIIVSAIIFVVALLIEHLSPVQDLLHKWFSNSQTEQYIKIGTGLLYMVSYLIIGRQVVIGAVKNLLKGHIFDEQFLMTVASLGAVFVGEFPEAVAVMLFYQIGEFFEDYAVDKSKDSISALLEICPETATVLIGDEQKTVKAEQVEIGDIVIVKPGERIPVDGIVVQGKTFLDTSALTGESVPREVFEGNEVYSGAINTTSVIQIECKKISSQSAASRILDLVSASNEKKTRTERFITRFSKVYTPIVCIAAVLVAIVPTVIIGLTQNEWQWSTWIYRALMFLVVSCPCALVISVPLAFFSGIGKASRMGILLKGSSAIENLSKTKVCAFDKTGTLTKGVFVVTDVHCVNPVVLPEDELVALAAHAEIYSNHPAAKSLRQAHHGECCSLAKVTDAQELSGRGIKVKLDGKTVLAGNDLLMKEEKVSGYQECDKTDMGTIVHVALEGKYCGHIVISDQTKEDAIYSLQKLKKAGVKKLVMLTGDNKKNAETTAKNLGLTECYGELLPEDKVSKIEELISEEAALKKNSKVAFAGDGINDAPVLARADVGIAMGALGSDAAIESADVVIMNDSLEKIADAIKISKNTKSVVYQNIVISLGVKVLIMLFSALGITGMWLAVFGDVGVCFLAILNSMRLLAGKK